MVSFKFLPCRPGRCYGNDFWEKINYNLVPVKDNCTLFSPTRYLRIRSIQWCYAIFSLKTPVVMAINRFYSKKKFAAGSQERQTLKRSC